MFNKSPNYDNNANDDYISAPTDDTFEDNNNYNHSTISELQEEKTDDHVTWNEKATITTTITATSE